MGIRIEGSVKPGFESVKKMFDELITKGGETNAQICVYFKGEKVVDLHGTSVGNSAYNSDSLQLCFSSSKSLAAICMACMVDQGKLDYDEKVCKYWPEFAHNGKEDIKVCDVLRHESGLVHFSQSIGDEDVSRENIKKNAIGKIIEESVPEFPKDEDSQRFYHSMTRGFILNEIFRRVEPKGRTIGEYLYEEINQKLECDVNIGLQKKDFGRAENLIAWGLPYVFYQSLFPSWMGRSIEPSFSEFMWTLKFLVSTVHSKKEPSGPPKPPQLESLKSAGYDMRNFIGIFNRRTIQTGELPSLNSMNSAKGFAKLGACIANGGELNGVRIMSKAGVDKMLANPIIERDIGLLGTKTEFTQGGVNFYRMYEDDPESIRVHKSNREGFYGWMGLGGSVFQWHPDLEIGFGWVTSQNHWYDVHNTRGSKFQAEVVKCAKALKSSM